MTWILLLSLFSPLYGAASSLRDACREFADGDSAAMKKCVSHGELFELNGDFVKAVTNFSADPEVRMKTLKSGANEQSLKICQATGWSVDHQISCMRSYPTEEVMKACRKISNEEEEQLRCVRIGREAGQIKGCIAFSRNLENRFECLENDMPAYDARACARKHKSEADRTECLYDFMAKRDSSWERPTRGIASEPTKSK